MAKGKIVKKKIVGKASTTKERDQTVVKATSAVVKKSNKATKHTLQVTQLRSAIGRQADQKKTLIGLGLNKLNKIAVVKDTNSVRGMINKVKHLIKVEKLM